MADDVADLDRVLRSIVEERGGRAAFSTYQLAAAHRLAQILTDGSVGSITAVAALTELLPARIEKPAKLPDWSLATAWELDVADRMLSRVYGETPAPRTKRQRQPLFAKEALTLARLVEEIGARVNPSPSPPYDEVVAARREGRSVGYKPPRAEEMTSAEMDEIHQGVLTLLAPLGMLAYSIVGLGPWAQERAAREKATAASSPMTLSAPELGSPEMRENVIAFQKAQQLDGRR